MGFTSYKRGAILRSLPAFSIKEICLETFGSEEANVISLVKSTLLVIQNFVFNFGKDTNFVDYKRKNDKFCRLSASLPYHNLDAAVAGAALVGGVVGDGAGAAVADCGDAFGVNSLLGQIRFQAVGAVER